MKSRIAPTPSGFLHQGNAFNFLLTDQLIRQAKGELLLRIDDLDASRKRPEYVEHIFETLNALQICWHSGPKTPEELANNWSQHCRLDRYQKVLQQLVATGLVYACDCSRKKVAATAVNGTYSGNCRTKGLELTAEGVSWRIDTRQATVITLPSIILNSNEIIDLYRRMGDFVIRKKDGLPAYQVCSLTDDLNFNIDLIVRGEDLLESSAAQYWLAGLIGADQWLKNLRLIHHRLLLDDNGDKLSKSAGARAVENTDIATSLVNRSKILEQVNHWLTSVIIDL